MHGTRLTIVAAGVTLLASGLLASGAAASAPPESPPPSAAVSTCDVAPSSAPGTVADPAAGEASPAGGSEPHDTLDDLGIPLPSATAAGSSNSAVATSAPLDRVLVLGRDGLGPARFCEDADHVVTELSDLLGPADEDTGWVEPFAISTCAGSVARRVTWGALDLYLGDESRFAAGPRHLYGYSYGNVDDFDVVPAGLATTDGIGLGTTVAFLRAAYPTVSLIPGVDGVQEPSFFVDEGLRGLLTDTGDDGVVTLIVGGEACGL